MLGISLKFEGLSGVEKLLKNPFNRVMAMSLNKIGEEIYTEQEKIAQSSFKTFNTYSRRSLFFWKTKEDKPLSQQNVVIGSFSPYLRKLEEGFKPSGFKLMSEPEKGRWIASKASRKSDGTINPKFALNKLQGAFVIKTKYGKILSKKQGKKLVRLRVLKKQVSKVKAYKWHSRAVDSKYQKGKIQSIFIQMWNS